MESVIAIGILGVALPLGVASMLSSGSLNQASAQETQASLLARTVRAELRAALRGQSQIIQSKTQLAEMTESQPLVLLADRYGNLNRASNLRMEEVRISVESPPRAPQDKRKTVIFIERMPRAL